jgi:hypothetical protein
MSTSSPTKIITANILGRSALASQVMKGSVDTTRNAWTENLCLIQIHNSNGQLI